MTAKKEDKSQAQTDSHGKDEYRNKPSAAEGSKGHHDTYNYPDVVQFQMALPHMLRIVTNQADDLDLGGKAKTVHTVASFAIGMALPHSGVKMGDIAESAELRELNDKAEKEFPAKGKGADPKGAFNWAAILLLAMRFLEELLRKEA
jgi:hypothetical protein